ncbi:L-arabinose isomerase family protein [Solibacillus silvestris]|uniref:L-arabinose isomerase family protein n=1 Tax=Solibacillus silvestris TaxID=76853 RepID=UPI003F7E2AEA
MGGILYKKARVGLYSVGLEAYWGQFGNLKSRIYAYNKFIEKRLEVDAQVFNFGLVDTIEKSREAGQYFNANNVDIILLHAGTYATSSLVLPIHQRCQAKVIVLSLQPTSQINYNETTIGEWLAQCVACPIPEFTNVLHRANIQYVVISGLLGLDQQLPNVLSGEVTNHRSEAKRAWYEILEWVLAAKVKRNLQETTIGFLGNTYSGMLDMYSDFTMVQAQTGVHIEVLEMCDLDALLKDVDSTMIEEKQKEMLDIFNISEDSSFDPLVRKPTEEQLNWACKTAAALQLLVESKKLDALTYYYHGASGNKYEQLQSGFILGHSLLTANGIPCAGEGDLKTAIAMKICDILQIGGSYSEIVATDYDRETILLGHDGPFHLKIADGKPILRGMGVYHGKQGTGVSVEAKVKTGPVTTLGVTQTVDGKLKFIVSEGQSTDDEIMLIGNTQTHLKFDLPPDLYMEKWFKEAPTHHCALAIGHNASVIKKVAYMLNIPVSYI